MVHDGAEKHISAWLMSWELKKVFKGMMVLLLYMVLIETLKWYKGDNMFLTDARRRNGWGRWGLVPTTF